MDNQQDSELFEIFQNKLDLEEEQKKSQESEDEQERDASEEETEDAKSASEDEESGKETEKETESPSPSSTTSNQPSSDEPPESTTDPSTETGTYIKKLEQEKALEGKIILSRGMAVFLLLIFIVTVLGAYFIGFNFGRNKRGMTAGTLADSRQPKSSDQKHSPSSTNKDTPATNDRASSNKIPPDTKQNNSNDSNRKNNVLAKSEAWYTFAVIGFDPQKHSDRELQKLINKHVKTIKGQGVPAVATLKNLTGQNRIWVVVGRFKSKESAKKNVHILKRELSRTEYNDYYRTDIQEINRSQAEKIE